MTPRLRITLILILYFVVFGIGLYLIFAGKDWQGYVAIISTPLLHTLVKSIDKYLSAKPEVLTNRKK